MKTWDEMTPRERDDLIAERVMDGKPGAYTSSRSGALSVVYRLKSQGRHVYFETLRPVSPWDTSRPWARIDDYDRIYADTLPEAICLASLHAIEADENAREVA